MAHLSDERRLGHGHEQSLNTRMLVTLPLAECLDLIHLMVVGDDCGPSFDLNGAHCGVERSTDDPHGWFGAEGRDWRFMMAIPDWYAGELGRPIHLSIEGDIQSCLQWLPIDRTDKLAILKRLRLGPMRRTLFTLAL